MYKKAWKKIIGSKNIVIASHVRADGDTLGCVLALYLALKSLKKSVKVYNCSKNLPKRFDFLPNFSKITDKFDEYKTDLLITCDCGSFDRVGLSKGKFATLNIDHHKSNTFFGDINIIDEDAPSASMVVFEFLLANEVFISKEIATCIYVGFVEDTGFFTYGNLTPKVMNEISRLVAYGVDMCEVAQRLKQNTPLCIARLKQYMYNKFYLIQNAMISVCVIDKDALKQTGCGIDDTKNMANLLLSLATVKVSILLVESEYAGTKVSLRSKGVDVGTIACELGGGGHVRAAGFELEYFEPEKIVKKIIEKINL